MVKFKEKRDNYYVFDLYEDGVLIGEVNQEGNTQKEAQTIIENRTVPSPIEEMKSSLTNEVKSSAKQFLDKTDYLVIRHLEQRELRVTTTLTDEEYTTLLTKRNKARNDSNTEEAAIKAKTTITDLEKIKISRKG